MAPAKSRTEARAISAANAGGPRELFFKLMQAQPHMNKGTAVVVNAMTTWARNRRFAPKFPKALA